LQPLQINGPFNAACNTQLTSAFGMGACNISREALNQMRDEDGETMAAAEEMGVDTSVYSAHWTGIWSKPDDFGDGPPQQNQ
jgi:hypothetical protein